MSRGVHGWWLQERGENRQWINKREVVKQMVAEASPNSEAWQVRSRQASKRLGDAMQARLATRAEWDAAWETFWATISEDDTSKEIAEACDRERMKWI
jgi:hypothetical protein